MYVASYAIFMIRFCLVHPERKINKYLLCCIQITKSGEDRRDNQRAFHWLVVRRNCFKMVVVGLSCVYWIACVPSGINKEINFVEICIGASDNHSRETICGSMGVCESDRSRLLIRSGVDVVVICVGS